MSSQDCPSSVQCQWINEDGKQCGANFPSLLDISAHLKKQHIGSNESATHTCRWSQCTTNAKPFKGKYELVSHVRGHTGEQAFRCEKCDKEFTRWENMKIHYRTHTADTSSIVMSLQNCALLQCQSINKGNYKLVNNLRATGEQPFKCEKCQKEYARSENLKIHYRTHTGDKPFNCLHPGYEKKFANSSDREKQTHRGI